MKVIKVPEPEMTDLWKAGKAREKDIVENWVHRQMCSGAMKLSQAPDAIRTWPQHS